MQRSYENPHWITARHKKYLHKFNAWAENGFFKIKVNSRVSQAFFDDYPNFVNRSIWFEQDGNLQGVCGLLHNIAFPNCWTGR